MNLDHPHCCGRTFFLAIDVENIAVAVQQRCKLMHSLAIACLAGLYAIGRKNTSCPVTTSSTTIPKIPVLSARNFHTCTRGCH